MSNLTQIFSFQPFKNCHRKYFSIFGCILILSVNILHAVDEVPSAEPGGSLGRRVRFLSPFPEVPLEEKVEPEKEEDAIKAACRNMKSTLEEHFNPLPLVDWLNVSNMPSFFDPTIRLLLKRDEYFNAIDSLGKYYLSAQPYGFSSNFKLDKDNFKLTTIGVTVDGGITLGEHWVIGGGLGYWHSSFDAGEQTKKSSVNSLYAGPYAGYVWDQAYVALTLLGVYNIYNIDFLFGEGKGKNRHEGWDAAARVEGGYDFEWPKYFGKNFFIQPNVDLSYLWAFQNKIEEKRECEDAEEATATVNSRTYDFFRSRLGVTFKKEFYHAEKGILIPSFSFGWALMQPLSQSKIDFTCAKSDEETINSKKYPSSNQVYVGAKVIGINKRGMMLSLGVDAYIAELYPIYGCTLRFEWDW